MENDQKKQYETQARALGTIIGAVRLAQKRGAFTLEEASQGGAAVALFAPAEVASNRS